MIDISILKEVNLFQDLLEAELHTLAQHSIVKHYKKNTVIVNKGDETSSLYIVLEGTLNAFVDDEQGKELILSNIGVGESFGELSLLSSSSRSASVISTTSCQLAIISKQIFMECLTKNPSIALNIIHSLINRVHNLTDNVSSLALLDVYGRIVNVLNKSAIEKGGKKITNKLTHQDIANMIGSSREMVSKILKDLKNGGYIKMDGKSIIIERTLPSGW